MPGFECIEGDGKAEWFGEDDYHKPQPSSQNLNLT